MNLWLDDLRAPPDKTWLWVQSVEEFELAIQSLRLEGKTIDLASLDHDLGGMSFEASTELTGLDAVKLLERENFWPKRMVVHSWNPEGARRMAELAAKHTRVIVMPFRAKEN